jgi:uroporphyrinogen-III synthase
MSLTPLRGIRVLVGRARHQASALSRGLKAHGAEVTEIPFIEIRPPRSYKPFDTALRDISKYDWLILTSVNGVEALAARLERLRISPAQLSHLQVAAIGPATRKAAERLGLKVTVVPRTYVAESVVASLRGKTQGKRVLLARAKVARDVIPRELGTMAAQVDVVEAYETVVPADSKKELEWLMKDRQRRPHIVTFTSSSTVRNFVQLLGGRVLGGGWSKRRHAQNLFAGIQFASIGPVTSSTLREFGLPVLIEAKEYTIPGLIRAIVASARIR